MPDQISLDQMHERLTTQQSTNGRLAAALHRITTTGSESLHTASREDLTAKIEEVTKLASEALAGKITDVLARVRREYEVLWHSGDDDNAIRLSEAKIGNLARALHTGPDRVGQYGITRFTVQFRTHVVFDDGSTWISGWEPVDYRGTLFPCIWCGQTVFRAGWAASTFFVDAEPVPDGELVLIPSGDHGGEPGAIYGEAHRPGQHRYHRHRDNCTTEDRR